MIMALRWIQGGYQKYRRKALYHCRRLLLHVVADDPEALAQLPKEVRQADILAHGLLEIAALMTMMAVLPLMPTESLLRPRQI